MTTPRQPYGPDDRDDDTATWGRPPAGGWGATNPGYGGESHEDRGDDYGSGYRGERGGEYGGEYRDVYREPPSERARREYERAGRGGTASGYGEGRYREPDPDPGAPLWAQGPPVTPRRAARRARRPPWIALAAAGVVVVAFLVLGFVTPGWFVTRVFDAAAVQTGITKILNDDYGVDGVADVHCPDRVPVASGATFTCDAAIDGDPVKVPVHVTDAKGGYEVGRPT